LAICSYETGLGDEIALFHGDRAVRYYYMFVDFVP
jgi:hypothetical protein